jgi:hypothetical protein
MEPQAPPQMMAVLLGASSIASILAPRFIELPVLWMMDEDTNRTWRYAARSRAWNLGSHPPGNIAHHDPKWTD